MNQLPIYLTILFILITFFTVLLFYKASNRNRTLLLVILIWITVQTVVALTGFFTVTNTIPPRIILLLALPLAIIAGTMVTMKGRRFIEGFDVKELSLLHTIRIGVELVLFLLFLNKALPQLMTFEGRNFDLLVGISAPLIYYYGFIKRKLSTRAIVTWNIVSLAILSFTVVNAILSAPTPFQKFGFEQPTVAVLYFPFVWLPGVVVPLVIMSHLVTIRSLLNAKSEKQLALLSHQVGG